MTPQEPHGMRGPPRRPTCAAPAPELHPVTALTTSRVRCACRTPFSVSCGAAGGRRKRARSKALGPPASRPPWRNHPRRARCWAQEPSRHEVRCRPGTQLWSAQACTKAAGAPAMTPGPCLTTDTSLLPCWRPSAFQVLWPCRTTTTRTARDTGGSGSGGRSTRSPNSAKASGAAQLAVGAAAAACAGSLAACS
jgi:hypothetical protein